MKKFADNIYAVIMAGGIGSRFWPMSTRNRPKQFLDILGTGKSLLQQTYERYSAIIDVERILIVTGRNYKQLVLEQIPELRPNQVLCEPNRRNTAPCIAYANARIAMHAKDATIVVAPADHLIINIQEFYKTLSIALDQAESGKCLVTLGIKPSRPDTGYGYIQFKSESSGVHQDVREVRTFTEKPDLDLSIKFLESGDFYWNSGMFIWKLDSIEEEMKHHLPKVYKLFEEEKVHLGTKEEEDAIDRIYAISPNVSIDYGVMEKAEKVYVVLSDFGWSDLGTWGSLYTHLEKDGSGNAVEGKQTYLYESDGCLVKLPHNKVAILHGLKDHVVVEANDVLLICKRQDEQKIKQFVANLGRRALK